MTKTLTILFAFDLFVVLMLGCKTPQRDYWSATDKLASALNERYGNSRSQIVPLPIADNYQEGTTLVKGIANGFACIFPTNAVLAFTSPMLATESNTVSFDLELSSPTNISQFTGDFNITAGKTVFVSYSHMALEQLDPQYYIPIISSTNSDCLQQLRGNLSDDSNTMMIVGYISGQFQMSQSKNFQIDLKGAAYGANGKIAYTNSGGWTVLTTNSVHCFAIISKPKLKAGRGPASIDPVHYDVTLDQPDRPSALKAVNPLK
jgi:hypothetical protein